MAEAVKDPSLLGRHAQRQRIPGAGEYYKGLSSELGVAPAQGQAASWVGQGPLTGLKTDDTATWLKLWQDRINNTAMRMGKSPQDVEAGFWRGEHPLLTGGGSPGR